jgi:hypothetical protein
VDLKNSKKLINSDDSLEIEYEKPILGIVLQCSINGLIYFLFLWNWNIFVLSSSLQGRNQNYKRSFFKVQRNWQLVNEKTHNQLKFNQLFNKIQQIFDWFSFTCWKKYNYCDFFRRKKTESESIFFQCTLWFSIKKLSFLKNKF